MSARRIAAYTASVFALASFQTPFAEENIQENETIEVIGITPTHGVGLPEELIPFNVQSAKSKDIEESQTLGLTDFMNRNLGSVTINDAQNNPLQADVQYRGYTLSPLLGLPQGLAVYQNGVRINEPFGDAMNWDLVPESSIGSINLIGGANPVFGLNTLGGSLSITTKNGFTHTGNSVETHGGSFGRTVTTVESGANNGKWGYFVTGEYFDEDGWRDASPSDALNLFGAISYRTTNTTLDLTYNHANTDLIGNGSSPAELLELDRAAVFTSPDQTENRLHMINLSGTHWASDTIQLSGNVFYRKNETDSFNGDGSEFEDCAASGGTAGELCEEDSAVSITDQNGATIQETVGGIERNAINNISNRDQEGFGTTVQSTFLGDLFGKQNQFIFGAGYQQGLVDFFSTVEIASLNCTVSGADCTLAGSDRGTSGTGLFVPEEGTEVKAHHRVWSLYATDTISVTDKLALTASVRYNNSHIVLGERDNSILAENNPGELNGEHDFDRINPAFGVTYNFNDSNGVYGSYSESSRAPTPIELLCADENAPCNLPNAFLADPPLEQVVTESFEGGFRGSLNNGINYNIAAFHSTNKNDIIFGSTGGTTSSTGFFRNVGDTRRVGTEFGLSGVFRKKLNWYLNYSFVEATFQDAFIGISANHPNAADLNGDGDADEIQVNSGDRIPGVPEHSFKLGGLYSFTPKFSVGANVIYNSTQVLRGDESNELGPVDGYAIVNINGTYKINNTFTLFARVNNLFDTDYETFGLLGEGDEVFDGSGATQAFTNATFLGAGAPVNGFVGMTISF
ncbi:MAG: TonB-dependent receptor [Proteobacteria bacterium]|nr:TonB-dependent receptor [Pseudomonadota bacterium]NOG61615.1 TonB-dependent receptor [Pseudomonadota bacterium]